jgi:hypothetical protein
MGHRRFGELTLVNVITAADSGLSILGPVVAGVVWEIFFSVAFARLGEAVFRSFLFTRFFIFLA